MTTTTAVTVVVDRWARLVRKTGIAGLITVAMLFAPIVAISTLGEPPFTATAEQAQAFFTNGSVGWAQLVTVVNNLAAIGLIWFVVGLALLLARARAARPGDRVSPEVIRPRRAPAPGRG